MVLLAALWLTAPAFAQDVTFSVKVDKTTVKVGDPVTMTITLGGDISGIELPAFQFPEEFSVAARSQSTNFSLRAGAAERSISLSYVLVPQREGSFQLGPFHLEHHGKTDSTEPITLTVEKPALSPQPDRPVERFTL